MTERKRKKIDKEREKEKVKQDNEEAFLRLRDRNKRARSKSRVKSLIDYYNLYMTNLIKLRYSIEVIRQKVKNIDEL